MSDYSYIDIHSHLNFTDFDKDREEIIARLKEEKIATITVGTTVADSKQAIALAKKHENLYATVGIHPTHAWTDADFAELDTLAAHPKVVAIGECGLDFYRLPKELGETEIQQIKMYQGQSFAKHIELALKHDKPLMIHCRAAYEEAYSILSAYKTGPTKHEHADRLRGNFHFYAGNLEMAKKFIALGLPGFTISFDGPITFARDYDEVIRGVPLTALMSETDAPFAAPNPHRGRRNEPAYVKEIVAALAEIRGEPFETVQKAMVENARRVFDLK